MPHSRTPGPAERALLVPARPEPRSGSACSVQPGLMRVAAVQCTASADREQNLVRAGDLVSRAASQGAELVVVPEHFSFFGNAGALRNSAEPRNGTVLHWAATIARENEIWLVAGSSVELAGGRRYNTTCLVSPNGDLVATYRKIHLFDVDVTGAVSRESDAVAAGSRPVMARITPSDARPVPIGLTICYDLRFPELYRVLTLAGALVMVVPSAFAAVTGRLHWEILVRARAIENQVFVIAAGQVGTLGGGFEAYGHSMIVDPWGTILAEIDDGPGFIFADLDLTAQQDARSTLPSLVHRRPSAYRRAPEMSLSTDQ
jgi:deaminated glutathione amidase